jgi:hypothetical protein
MNLLWISNLVLKKEFRNERRNSIWLNISLKIFLSVLIKDHTDICNEKKLSMA